MANHVVIRAAATIFCINCKIVDWKGRMTVAVPFGNLGCGNSDVYFAYTGNHYMLLTEVGCPVVSKCDEGNRAESVEKHTKTERHKKAKVFEHFGPEEYNPGLSVFKGRALVLDEILISSGDESVCDSVNQNSIAFRDHIQNILLQGYNNTKLTIAVLQ
ncbi:uncharacterized protein [Antedon mediterranea]|uniref:uncharacterized protein n=1 Tax=Antedon mediterranea TaxID=105859 RepID=UPI003AF75A05